MAKYRITASPSHGSKGYETLWYELKRLECEEVRKGWIFKHHIETWKHMMWGHSPEYLLEMIKKHSSEWEAAFKCEEDNRIVHQEWLTKLPIEVEV